jgi:hypothetical protein
VGSVETVLRVYPGPFPLAVSTRGEKVLGPNDAPTRKTTLTPEPVFP